MKYLFLFSFFVSVQSTFAQLNGIENNSNSNNLNTSPNLFESKEVEIPAIQEDLEFDQKTIEVNKSKELKNQDKSRTPSINASEEKADGYTTTIGNFSELSITMDELLFDIKYNNTRKTPSAEQNQRMNKLLKEYEKINKESFEYNYFTYFAGRHDIDNIDYLRKAEALKPQNTDVQIQLAAYYFIKDIPDSAAIYLQKLVDVQRIDSTALIYAKELLSSVSNNGTLITHGFDDSYACAYLQKVQSFRNDVTLLPFEFFQSSFFLNRMKKSNIVVTSNKIIDNEYFNNFILNNKNNNIHISVSFPKDYILLIEIPIYIKGLTFIIENNQNELINENIDFYESITKNLILISDSDKSKQLSVNYLPMLFLLKDYYKSLENVSKVNELEELITRVAVQSGKYEWFLKLEK
jgi:hypothetical protein